MNGRCYIGSAVNLAKRWRDHQRGLNEGTHKNRYLQSSWNKHGAAAFRFSVLELVEDVTRLVEREQVHIDSGLADNNLYNLSPTAGSNLGLKRSPEIRAAMKVTAKNTYAARPELKAKLREASKNRILSDDLRVRLGLSAKNRVWTDDMRSAVSKQFKGFARSKESVERSAAARRKPILCVDTGIVYGSLQEVQAITGISWSNVSQVCRGIRPRAGGFSFKYYTLEA